MPEGFIPGVPRVAFCAYVAWMKECMQTQNLGHVFIFLIVLHSSYSMLRPKKHFGVPSIEFFRTLLCIGGLNLINLNSKSYSLQIFCPFSLAPKFQSPFLSMSQATNKENVWKQIREKRNADFPDEPVVKWFVIALAGSKKSNNVDINIGYIYISHFLRIHTCLLKTWCKTRCKVLYLLLLLIEKVVWVF